MERKHQVFVSSTYNDLITERQHVIHALLELDCIPAGMELFPAADEDAWTLIKEVIDNSDYYLLIIAGKYGSIGSEGISYTEMEFDYAVSIKKPIFCFLHHNIDELKGSNIEKSEEKQKKLELFRKKASQRHCNLWKSAEDLGGKVSRSLIQMRKKHPSPGWIQGKYAADESLFRTLEELRMKVQELESREALLIQEAPVGSESLAQGDETNVQPCEFKGKYKKTYSVPLEASWDKLFSYAGTEMIGECTDDEFREKIQLAYYHSVPEEYTDQIKFGDILVYDVNFDRIKIQLQALGLITYGTKKRAVSDTKTYWKLTPYGEKYLLKIRAIKSKKYIIK